MHRNGSDRLPVPLPRPAVSPQASAFLKQRHRLLIDGEWIDAVSGATFQTFDPATGALLATVAEGGPADVDRAVASARAALDGPWSRMLPKDRAAMIDRLGRLIGDNHDRFVEIEILDNGMTLQTAQATVGSRPDLFNYYAGWPLRIEGATIPNSTILATMSEMFTYTLKEPVGVAGLIVPWNVPLAIACLKLAPALAAGCTVVLKPAELTPLSAQLLGELTLEAGFPKGVVNIVQGYGHTVGAAMAAHDGIDKISFTGSTATGRSIIAAARGNLKRVSLELGGKAPAIVFDDADVERAIGDLARAIFGLQGQNCMAATRLYVQRGAFDRVVSGIAAAAEQLTLGHGLNPETSLGPLITLGHRDRVAGFVQSGKDEGAELVSGGRDIPGPGNFIQPTVFAGTGPTMRIVREEVFGPLVCVQPFDDDDIDAIAAQANDSPYGLAASIWTTSLSRAHRTARRLRSGQISINCHGVTGVNIPFGGFKQSGWGREFGRDGLDAFLETKSVTARL